MGSTEEIRTWAISVRSMMASEQLIDLDMFIGRALAVIGAQIHAGQHDLGHAGLLSFTHLFEHGLNGHGTLGAAGLPHDAIGTAVVAAILDLHAQPRTTERIDHVAIAARRERYRTQRPAPRRHVRRH